MTLCQICFWLARWTRTRILCYHGPIFQRPRRRRAQRERERVYSCSMLVGVCVGGRVCGACQWLSPSASASASERTSASAAKYATLLAFGRRCGKKPPKAPHPQTKHKFGERRNSCRGCQCCPPTQRNETRRIGNVHGTGTGVCSVPGYYFVLHIITDYACCTPAAAKLASKSDRCVIYSSFRENSNYPFEKLLFRVRKKCK